MSFEFSLPLPDNKDRKLITGWLLLGLGSLIIAGIFSILLVLSRVPQAQDFIPWLDFFHTSIVIHVDMSVLIWFLSFGCLLWTLTTRRLNSPIGWLSLFLAVSGTIIVGVSPFMGAGDPLMNNYVPVLRHPLFYSGLSVFGLGITILVLAGLKPDAIRGTSSGESCLRIGTYSALVITAVSIISLAWAFVQIPRSTEDHAYFEYLFWGSGHTVQFAYTQLMLVSWIWLYSVVYRDMKVRPAIFSALLILGALPVIFTPLIQFMHGSFSPEYRQHFTTLMRMGGGIAALPIGLILVWYIFKSSSVLDERHKPLANALLASILLFGAGGVLGFMTDGVNTIIPAHYHGSIVGVTLALMGFIYFLLPHLGFQAPVSKLARLQPYIYAGGQFIHISGLAVAGAMGIQRKTAGAAQGLDSMTVKAVMGIMGLGGLIAIIGGIIFLVVTINAMRKPKII